GFNPPAMKWEICHRTRYLYASPVRESFNEVRLQPVSNEHQSLESFDLKLVPASRLRHYQDFHHNVVHHFELVEPHSSLLIEAVSVVKTLSPVTLTMDARPAGLQRLAEAALSERCMDFLQAS